MLSTGVSLDVDVSADDVMQAHKRRMKDAAQRGYQFSQEVVPSDTGKLKQTGFDPEWRGNDLVYGYTAGHAIPMEYGTEPGHYPPVDSLVRWAERIGKDPGFGYYVARVKIPQEGVDAQPYLRPSGEIVQQYLDSHGLDL